MSQMLLVNPRRRAKSRKRRSPAQKAATRRLVARNKARGGTTRRRRRRNPVAPGTTRKVARRRSNPRRRRIATAFSQRQLTDYLTAATWGASGAIALDVVLPWVPLPAMFKVGIPGKITKGAAAILLGAVANMTGMVRASTARDMTVGALTVQFTGIGRELLAQFAPGVALGAYMNEDYAAVSSNNLGYAGSGWNPSQALNWNNNGMGAYNVGSDYDIAAPGMGQPGMGMYEADFNDF